MAHYEDFTIEQGVDVAIELHLVNKDTSAKDLTGHSIEGMIKPNYAADSSQAVPFNTVISDPIGGVVTLALTNIQTDAFDHQRRYVYDVELSHLDSDSTTIIERVLEGKITVKPSVTR